MTEFARQARCRWCGRPLPDRAGRGRPRRFCRQACRQREYISRLRAAEAGLSEQELVVARAELDDLRDRLYVLECAVDDARRDLSEGDAAERVLGEVLAAAEPLFGIPLGDRST